MLLLIHTYGIGDKGIAVPQATLMSMVVKGVMTGIVYLLFAVWVYKFAVKKDN